jgi:aryl-alcohol dehydrogenase-like predicted oxidoreductase
MRTRRLGDDGPEITTVGFGAWAVGGPWQFGWGPQEDEHSIAAIRHALDAGVNWVDTAAAYGLGHSEEMVGRALDAYAVGSDVYVFTKCGLNWYGSPDGSVSRDLRPESIRNECEQSLKRLGVERIDLYQFHWPDETGTPVEESWGVMSQLIDEGKVRWGGVSNFGVDLLERCEKVRHVDSLQPPLNMIDRSAARDVIRWSKGNGTGVIVYSPMASGLLTGKYDEQKVAELSDDDWRKASDQWRGEQLSRNLALVRRLEEIAGDIGTALPALTVAWTLAVGGVTAAIVGARRPTQVDGWIAAGEMDLGEDVRRAITTAIEETGAGDE